MSAYRKLMENSLVFAIGNLGSTLVNFLLVPLYTYHLSTSEYGMADIVTTTTKLLLPIISVSVYNAILRYSMDENYSKASVLTNGSLITIIGTLCFIILLPIILYFNFLEGLILYMYFILILQSIHSNFSQFIRGIGKVKLFASNGVLMTIVTTISNIILLVVFDKGIDGYLISIIIANIISILYLSYYGKVLRYIKFDLVDMNTIKSMITYSIPLIPNSIMWWVINASSRYFILFFSGSAVNGLYAVASKIPSILTIFNQIFNQAWQISAIEEYDSINKSKFYSNVFDYLSSFLLIVTSIILIIIKLLVKMVVAEEYYDAWKYVPFLLLGVLFSSYSTFLATNYIAAKETKGVFRTSLAGGITNLISNLILVPFIGANGSAMSTALSFFVMWVMRIYDTKKYIDIELDYRKLSASILVIIGQIIILYCNISVIAEFVVHIVLFCILVTINYQIIKKIIFMMLSKNKKPE